MLFIFQSLSCCLTLCNPMDCSTPGFPVFHYIPEFVQTHVHWVDDAIQPSHPLLPSFPPALNLSQHQDPFQWAGCLHQMAKLLELQHQFFQWATQGRSPLRLTGFISFLSKRLSRVFSSTIIQKHLFFSAFPSLWSSSHNCTWLLVKTIALPICTFVGKSDAFVF